MLSERACEGLVRTSLGNGNKGMYVTQSCSQWWDFLRMHVRDCAVDWAEGIIFNTKGRGYLRARPSQISWGGGLVRNWFSTGEEWNLTWVKDFQIAFHYYWCFLRDVKCDRNSCVCIFARWRRGIQCVLRLIFSHSIFFWASGSALTTSILLCGSVLHGLDTSYFVFKLHPACQCGLPFARPNPEWRMVQIIKDLY